MPRCVIIDDEQHAVDVLVRYVKQLAALELAGTSTDPFEGIELVRKFNADLVFMDIHMGRLNGIELAGVLPKNVRVIFCTGFKEFASDAFDMGAVDYLLKPIAFDRFMRAIQKVPNFEVPENMRVDDIPSDYFYLRVGRKGNIKLFEYDQLDYIEAKSNYISLYCGSEKTMVYLSIQKIEARLPKFKFVRIHRSFIVALRKIKAVQNNTVILQSNNTAIPIGESYREAFFQSLESRLFK